MSLYSRNEQSFCARKNSVFCKSLKVIKKPFLKSLLLTAVTGFAAILYISEIGCVWRFYFGFPCPGCGMTRALISLLSGDVSGAFAHHFMFPSIPIIFAYIIYDGRIFARKWVDYVVLSLLSVGFFVHWIMELI